MQEYSVEITDAAQADIKEIISYISLELMNPLSAKRQAKKFRESILSLGEMPKRQNLVSDELLSKQGIRKLKVDNYLVFYIIDESKIKVSIIRVLFGRRDWEKLI